MVRDVRQQTPSTNDSDYRHIADRKQRDDMLNQAMYRFIRAFPIALGEAVMNNPAVARGFNLHAFENAPCYQALNQAINLRAMLAPYLALDRQEADDAVQSRLG